MTEVERMVVKLLGDSKSFDRMMEIAEKDIDRFTKVADRQIRMLSKKISGNLDKIGSSMTSIGLKAGLMGAAISGAFGSIIGLGLKSAGSFEQTEIAFGTLLGSAEKAKETLADLTDFAALTPFEMPEIEEAARGLITFGETGDQLMDSLNILGNAASGTSSDFGMLALIFNQIRGVGKLLTQDFRQLSTRGVLFLTDIAKHFGVTEAEAQEMISTGKVGFEDVRDILRGLSSEGGRFENMMEKQSQSFEGLMSTLSDAIGITLRDIGTYFIPAAKQITAWLIQAAEYVRNFSGTTKVLIATFLGLGTGIGVTVSILGSLSASIGLAMTGLSGMIGQVKTLALVSKIATTSITAMKLAMAGVGVAAAALIGYQVGKAIADWFDIGGAKEFNKELQRTKELSTEILKLQNKRNQGVLDTASTKKGGDKKDFLTAELEKAERDFIGIQFQIKATERNVADLAPTWKSAWQAGKAEYEGAVANLDELNQKLKQQKTFIQAMREQLGDISIETKGPSEETIQGVKDYIGELQLEVETLGMAKEEAYLYKMEAEGIDQALLDQVKTLQEHIQVFEQDVQAQEEAMAAQQRAKETIDGMVASLEEAVATYGMSESQLVAWKLAQEGADQATIDSAVALQDKLDAMREHDKLLAEEEARMERIADAYKRAETLYEAYQGAMMDSRTFDASFNNLSTDLAAEREGAGIGPISNSAPNASQSPELSVLNQIKEGILALVRKETGIDFTNITTAS